MTDPHVILTADNLSEIENESRDLFKKPLRLIAEGSEWRLCYSDFKPFGTANSYHVVRQGVRYRLEARSKKPPQPRIIHRGAA